MRVAIYHKSVPNAKSQEKIDLLRYYAEGVRNYGDSVVDVNDYSVQPADASVIQGWVSKDTTRPHLALRNTVIRTQPYVVGVDSNLFLYADTTNAKHYLRYSFNGIFPNTGVYCDNEVDPHRWQQISRDLGITLKPYRTHGDHILLCLQRNGGWSMGSLNVITWATETINSLRQHTDRTIVVRAHPGDKSARTYLGSLPLSNKIKLSTNASLIDDLRNCWAAVNINSSPVVGAAIEGVPIFVTDPTRSQCQEIANTDLSKIEEPKLVERQAWVERISMFHWNFNELQTGACWQHMRRWVK